MNKISRDKHHSESYNVLMKKLKMKETDEIYTMFWLEQSISSNDHTTKAIYRFNLIPIMLPMACVREWEQKTLADLYGDTKTLNSQNNPEKERMELEESCFLTSNYNTKLQ